jgi:serine protease Do
MEDLKKYGKVLHAWLGIYIQDITEAFAEKLDLGVKAGEGVLVTSVIPGSPADRAGIKRYDVILSVDDVPVKKAIDLQNEIRKHRPKDEVKLEIMRDKKKVIIKVILGEYKEEFVQRAEVEEEKEEEEEEKVVKWRGATIQELTEELASHFDISKDEKGVLVADVEYASSADIAGLKRGDLIKELNRIKIENFNDFKRAIKRIKKQEDVVLLVKRKEYTFFLTISGEE